MFSKRRTDQALIHSVATQEPSAETGKEVDIAGFQAEPVMKLHDARLLVGLLHISQ
jgi:hypothetical protein